MRVLFTGLARQELEDATAFYEQERPGLGGRFREEVRATIRRIQEHPASWPVVRDDVRAGLLYRFPYRLLYSTEVDYLLIIAIAHQHRRPDYWVGRK